MQFSQIHSIDYGLLVINEICKYLVGDENQNNKKEERQSKGKLRPHSYLLNDKSTDTIIRESGFEGEKTLNAESSDEKIISNGAPDRIDGTIIFLSLHYSPFSTVYHKKEVILP